MTCPHCSGHIDVLSARAPSVPEIAPLVCEDCGELSLAVFGMARELIPEELNALKGSSAWESVLRAKVQIDKRNERERRERTEPSMDEEDDHHAR